MYYVYILYSARIEKKYIGVTSDLKGRLAQHNSGHSDFTSKGMPWKLVYYEVFKSEVDAVKEEAFLKTGKGRDRLKFLLEDTMKYFGEIA